MKTTQAHPWQVPPLEAKQIQKELAARVLSEGEMVNPKLVLGLDISTSRFSRSATGAAVVLRFPGLQMVEVKTVSMETGYPYIPGLLSFREAPVMLAACEKLSSEPDLVIVDGQGIAHPRRLGLASHIGLILGLPTIGCAKSRLCGRYETPGISAGSRSYLYDGDEIIGIVLRTRDNVKPVFVSVGHNIELENVAKWTRNCTSGYRLPEPLRMAHLAAGGNLASCL